MERLRITFEKQGALCYTSHLDLQKVWMRAMLRAKLPLAYTQGFHPTPKVGYAWPLPLGWSTSGELIDIWLDESIDLNTLVKTLNRCVPPGLHILEVQSIPLSTPSLTTAIISADYRVLFPAGTDAKELQTRIHELMTQDEILWERRGKKFDLKALVEHVEVRELCGMTIMLLRMAARESAMGRPDEFIAALGYDFFSVRFERVKYYL